MGMVKGFLDEDTASKIVFASDANAALSENLPPTTMVPAHASVADVDGTMWALGRA